MKAQVKSEQDLRRIGAAERRRAGRESKRRVLHTEPIPTQSIGALLARGERRRTLREERSKSIFEGGALAAILRHAAEKGKRPRRKASSVRKMAAAPDLEVKLTRGERKRLVRRQTNDKINAQQKAEADRRRKLAERFR